jgi:SPP1 family predicted phage head-tail adaptor
MLAGKLRHPVKLQAPLDTQDAEGQPTIGWTDVASIWADIRFVNGLESLKSDALVSVARCSIRIRARSGVTAGMRIAEGSTYYDIKAILPDLTGRRFIDLSCETGANNG